MVTKTVKLRLINKRALAVDVTFEINATDKVIAENWIIGLQSLAHMFTEIARVATETRFVISESETK